MDRNLHRDSGTFRDRSTISRCARGNPLCDRQLLARNFQKACALKCIENRQGRPGEHQRPFTDRLDIETVAKSFPQDPHGPGGTDHFIKIDRDSGRCGGLAFLGRFLDAVSCRDLSGDLYFDEFTDLILTQ